MGISFNIKFLDNHRWYQWVPNGEVISGTGQGESLKTAVTTHSGESALVYFPNNSHTRVNNILDREAEAYWFYPRDGQVQKVKQFKRD